MLFCEDNQNWQPVPPWAQFLIEFGHGWPSDERSPRRIALISMPCDSAGAGLITLGVMIRDLESPNANDLAGHNERLHRHARQYLEACKECELETCEPKLKGCGYVAEAEGRVRSLRFPRRVYLMSDRSDPAQGRLGFTYRNGTYWPNSKYFSDWYLDGDAPLQLPTTAEHLDVAPYQAFFNGKLHADNSRTSYSGLCLIGRAGGDSATRDILGAIKFRNAAQEHSLDGLLTIQSWSDAPISRAVFFNSRTQRFDHTAASPVVSVADGDVPFLKALSREEFQQSDVIGVFSRTIEREALELLGTKLEGLRQWYEEDDSMNTILKNAPRGVAVKILKRRSAK